MGIVDQYLLQLNRQKQRFRRNVALLTALSLLVVLAVSWNLRQTGVAIANDACCGKEEHQHDESCISEKVLICGYEVENSTESSTEAPSETPTEDPTKTPTEPPSETPTEDSAEAPTEVPSETPTETPTEAPTEEPIEATTEAPTEATTEAPTEATTEAPTEATTEAPTEATTEAPTEATTEALTEVPTEVLAEAPAEDSTAHIHSAECYEVTYLCDQEEHIHDFSCYSDLTADLEDWAIWAASVPELTGRIAEDIVRVAQSQLGCGESTLNFELADDGETRNGITRYGQWYGNPYGAWSNMFTSFCLRYAGLTAVPINSGAEKMQLEWENLNLYRYAGGYEPVSGDIVFLDKNQNGTVESTAVVVRYFDFILTVIEGDVNNAVVQREYRIDDPMIIGYGMTNSGGRIQMMATGDTSNAQTVGQAVTYMDNSQLAGNTFILYTTTSDNRHFAIDGNGNAVEVEISNTGVITLTEGNANMLYWTFINGERYNSQQTFKIQNTATKIYLHPNGDGNTRGPFHGTDWSTYVHNSGGTVQFQGLRQNYYAMLSGTKLTITNDRNQATRFKFGRAPTPVTVWLDGTNGNIMSYRGSNNTKYTVYTGLDLTLPSSWKSPTKYSYTLAGWVDISTGKYYLPGEKMIVTKSTVLYADWVASTYDIGQYNSFVADTVSTNDFITTHVFDYSSLINLLSTRVSMDVDDNTHRETWTHVADPNKNRVEDGDYVTYKDQITLDFSFNDHDSSGTITNPTDRGNQGESPNAYTGGTAVYPGIYDENPALGAVLFGTNNLFNPETGEGIIGKHYLGQGDHLFQIDTDPNSRYYGYYYYDAKRNAASYNQSDQRFYVYEYLERTSDSANNNDAGKYSDFLPLNSPYANTNGQTLKTYTYAAENGKYSGVTHYAYDARYDSDSSAAGNVKANLWFGMRVDVVFDLPDVPGEKNSNGEYGNKDIYGNDMHFKFTGDDDVWILLDNQKVILDLGGIHQAADGDINFSTGMVHVNDDHVATLEGIKTGEHTLSILYLERGSSMSNCAIYFNLAPRFSLTLEKEDVLTQEVLDGATFGFYTAPECTDKDKCELWPSKQPYIPGTGTNEFTIENGKLTVWGLSPSRTYYIKELTPPTMADEKEHSPHETYDPVKGVIKLTLDKNGQHSHSAIVQEEIGPSGEKIPVSHGFTVHGFQIDEENQAVHLVITNAQNWVKETTSVYAEKIWNDSEDHTYDSVTVYLNVTDTKGAVRRIREAVLSETNGWKYAWTNLPKYILDPDTQEESESEVQYSVSEAYVPGYTHKIDVLESGDSMVDWAGSAAFKLGGVYILKTNQGCLSAVASDQKTLQFVDEATAQTSPLARWTATVSDNKVRLTNEAGQSLNYVSSGDRYYNVTTATNNIPALSVTDPDANMGLRLYYQSATRKYYISDLNSSSYASTATSSNSALVFYPLEEQSRTNSNDGTAYYITNTPLTTETSVKVIKQWDHPNGDVSAYEKEQITVRLLANGVDTGRAEIVSLKNNWQVTFNGLPYLDAEGNPIRYTVVEIMESADWIPSYGEITVVENNGGNPTYETIVTNHYLWTNAVELPATGGTGYPLYVLIGLILISAPFVYGFSLRRRYRKEARE